MCQVRREIQEAAYFKEHMREDHPDKENQIGDEEQEIEDQDQNLNIQKEIKIDDVEQEMENLVKEYQNKVEKVSRSEPKGSLKRKRIMEMEEQQGGKSYTSLKGEPVALEQPEIVLDNQEQHPARHCVNL